MVHMFRAALLMASLVSQAPAFAVDLDVFGSDYSIPKAYARTAKARASWSIS